MGYFWNPIRKNGHCMIASSKEVLPTPSVNLASLSFGRLNGNRDSSFTILAEMTLGGQNAPQESAKPTNLRAARYVLLHFTLSGTDTYIPCSSGESPSTAATVDKQSTQLTRTEANSV